MQDIKYSPKDGPIVTAEGGKKIRLTRDIQARTMPGKTSTCDMCGDKVTSIWICVDHKGRCNTCHEKAN